jgi:hypothetical protein
MSNYVVILEKKLFCVIIKEVGSYFSINIMRLNWIFFHLWNKAVCSVPHP